MKLGDPGDEDAPFFIELVSALYFSLAAVGITVGLIYGLDLAYHMLP